FKLWPKGSFDFLDFLAVIGGEADFHEVSVLTKMKSQLSVSKRFCKTEETGFIFTPKFPL
ncbi:MAG: hypothetical protein B7Z16_17680, partial [Algoriphagus sp. 32-45-6]